MAIESDNKPKTAETPPTSKARTVRWMTGTNVAVAIILAIALVALLQWGGYSFNTTADMTSSGINSLSEGTEKLLKSLNTEVHLTSMYFEADPEPEEQPKFRGAVRDLVDLYRIANPSKIVVEYVNPLQDHQRRKEFFQQLQQIPKFQEQVKPYKELTDDFTATFAAEITDALSEQQKTLSDLSGGIGETPEAKVLAELKRFTESLQRKLTQVEETLSTALQDEVPNYSAAMSSLRGLYENVEKIPELLSPQALESFAGQLGVSFDSLAPNVLEYLRGVAEAYKPVAEHVKAELEKAKDLPELELETIMRQYAPDGNCIFVTTPEDARIITFAETWPPAQSGAARGGGIASREFRGEEKISSAILQATQPTKPAVVFVRFGGPPLFFGGFQPNMPRAPYMEMKEHLESVNFTVHEWDLATSTTPPEIDPAPKKIAYVVLKPTPPPSPMMGRQPETPTFGEEHRKALIDALGKDGRALFITGWVPGQFGLFPSPYEYGDYLKNTWGIDVASDVLIMRAIPTGPNEFALARGFQNVDRIDTSDNVMVQGLGTRHVALPLVAPLNLPDPSPEGVKRVTLIRCPAADGLWGVKNVQERIQQQQSTGKVQRGEDDLVGPFTIAAAATKDDANVVVVSSPFFAVDEAAFATDLMLTAQGLRLVNANPGNVMLFVNALHWLTDNTQWMNLGRPIDEQVIEIEEGPGLTFVRALAYGIWPALALVCGGIVWFIRRR